MAWLYLPESVALNLVCRSPTKPIEPCVTLSGKATQRPMSWRGWKKRPWIRLLSGTTFPRSTAARGVALWILSLGGSPAKTSRRRGKAKASKKATVPDSGPSSIESLARYNPGSSSWRTSELSLFGGLIEFSGTWPSWGSMRNGELFERPRSGLPTVARGFSSWPTARSEDAESCGNHPGAQDSLTGIVKNPRGPGGPLEYRNPIPGESDDEYWGRMDKYEKEHGIDPTAGAPLWPTPMLPGNGGSHGKAKMKQSLENWMTPAARIYKGSGEKTIRKDGKSRMDMLDYQAEQGFQHSPQGPQTQMPGQKSSVDSPSSPQQWRTPGAELDHHDRGSLEYSKARVKKGYKISTADQAKAHMDSPTKKLNPLFVEWLMGFPIGWTDFEPLGMEWFRWWRRMRSELSRLVQE